MKNRKLVAVTQNRLTAAALIKRIGIMAALAGSLSACAGFGVKMEGYRIDELQAAQKTYPKPIKCLFTSCPEWDSQSTGDK